MRNIFAKILEACVEATFGDVDVELYQLEILPLGTNALFGARAKGYENRLDGRFANLRCCLAVGPQPWPAGLLLTSEKGIRKANND